MDRGGTGDDNGDLSLLGDLREDTILDVIKNRFHKDRIYSWCGGDILIAVNPYKPLEIYGKQHHENYDYRKPKQKVAPHIYATTAKAYQRLRETRTDQIVLVSGESGAGKTESTKYVIKHLLKMCESKLDSLQMKIMDVNPLMEAFGNAQTALNENSSRFAKYIRIKFNSTGGVTGATIRDYLLEKSRVVHQAPKEMNFHIFYYFLAGASENAKDVLNLDQKSYRITGDRQGRHSDLLKRKYDECLRIMKLVGLTESDIEFVQSILAAILHIGEIKFETQESDGVIVLNETEMHFAAALLDIDDKKFSEALVSEKISCGGEEILTLKNGRRAADGRDALAKALYERLFGWLITKINQSIQGLGTAGLSTELGAIGILDICGFEVMETNRLEQLCINLVNEQLQNFMNNQVFKQEMEIYESEGLKLEAVDYSNNTEIIRMFDMPKVGILDLINEDTKLNQATNMSMINKIADRYSTPHFTPDPHNRPKFKIQHFAGRVEYDASSFLEKNGDNLSKDLKECVMESRDELICDLFTVEPANTGSISTKPFNYRQSRKSRSPLRRIPENVSITRNTLNELKQSISKNQQRKITADPPKDHKTALSYLKGSLQELLQKMKEAEPFFIRCIKPNVEQKSDYFSVGKVKEQLMYIGIKDIAEIRKLGYPLRRHYDDFINRYSDIVPESKAIQNDKAASEMILKPFFPTGREYRLGKRQIFMFEVVRYRLEGELKRRQELISRYVHKWKQNAKRVRMRRQNKESKRVKIQSPASPRRMQNKMETIHSSGNSDSGSYNDLNANSCSVKLENESQNSENVDKWDAHEEDDEEENKEDEEDPYEDVPFWDQFQMLSPESETTELDDDRMLRFMKIFFYGVLFTLLLGTSVLHKISFVNSISRLNFSLPAVERIYLLMSCVLAVCAPYALNVLIGVVKILFGNFRKPSIATFIVVLLMETLHSFGLCILLFFVFPWCDGVIILCLMCGVAIMPALLLLISSTDKTNNQPIDFNTENKNVKIICRALDVLSALVQLSVVVVLILFLEEMRAKIEPLMKSMLSYKEASWLTEHLAADYVLFGFSLFLVSFGWWENFLDDRCFTSSDKITNNRVTQFFLRVRYEQQSGRNYTSVLSNILKIGITILMAYVHCHVFEYETSVVKLKDELFDYDKLKTLVPVISLNLCGIVLWYTSYIACKLNMQIGSFSFPLLLATPVSMLILCLGCEGIMEENPLFSRYVCPKGFEGVSLYSIGGIGWYLSLMWITRHIWFPKQERLAKYERLFSKPLYCGMLPVENCLLNRRRHARTIKFSESVKDEASNDVVTTYKLSSSDSKNESDLDESASTLTSTESKTDSEIPLIYACATMWHETRIEMLQLLKSIHRIDADQCIRREAQDLSRSRDPDFYNYEAHIFFDDAMELNDDDEWQANDFVAMLVECMEEAVSSVYNQATVPHPPIKIPTPYGGRLLYAMPGGNNLFVHLKDKNKIRHRKRWSQVMYMYYLLGYNLFWDCEESTLDDFDDEKKRDRHKWKSSDDLKQHFSDEIASKSQNTFILALDGDTDFSPVAVRILLDRMKKNEKAGAACGRIHPIGSGPLIWYQKFEYAVGHWLQKASEHVFGCVLCSPGCFSLFRGSALMDQNVMRRYAILPTQPGHYLQYDQGEDRWLCTLLLQQGYRVDYAAAADAYTYAPEGFKEFFNQRRRWMPSTMANIMDLLNSTRQTVAVNDNISLLYIIYQASLMVSTVLGPATVLMMIAASFNAVFKWDIEYCYLASLGPTVVFVIICLKTKSETQLLAAAILSTLFAFVMVMVLAGTLITAVQTTIFDPSVIFLAALIFVFLFAGFLHPYEFGCLPAGALYFICIPSGYLLLVIYSFANLDNVSWGTREIPKKKTKAELAAEAKAAAEKKKQGGFFANLFCNRGIIDDFKEIIRSFVPGDSGNAAILSEMRKLNRNMHKMLGDRGDDSDSECSLTDIKVESMTDKSEDIVTEEEIEEEEEIKRKKPKVRRNDLKNPYWIEDERLLGGEVGQLHQKELTFWKDFIRKYLKPLDKDPEKEKIVKSSLIELRTNVMFLMCMINLLWIGINFMFQISKTQATTFTVTYEDVDGNEKELKVEVLGLIFIFFFALVLLLQLCGMVIHRWGTLLHVTSITEIKPTSKSPSTYEKILRSYKEAMEGRAGFIPMKAISTSAPKMNGNVPVTRETFRKSSDIFQARETHQNAQPEVWNSPNNWRRSRQGLSRKKRGPQLRMTTNNIVRRAKKELHIPIECPEPDYDIDDNEFIGNGNALSKFLYQTQRNKSFHRPSLRNSRRFEPPFDV